ncbi:MAG: hypothetical protein Q9176_006556 [Flavoplaca citrina]
MDPGSQFIHEVIQDATDSFRTGLISIRPDQTSFNDALDDILRQSLHRWFSTRMSFDSQSFGPAEQSHIGPMVEALRPRLALQVMEYQRSSIQTAYDQETTQAPGYGHGEQLQSISSAAELFATSQPVVLLPRHNPDRHIPPVAESYSTSLRSEFEGWQWQDSDRQILQAAASSSTTPMSDIAGWHRQTSDHQILPAAASSSISPRSEIEREHSQDSERMITSADEPSSTSGARTEMQGQHSQYSNGMVTLPAEPSLTSGARSEMQGQRSQYSGQMITPPSKPYSTQGIRSEVEARRGPSVTTLSPEPSLTSTRADAEAQLSQEADRMANPPVGSYPSSWANSAIEARRGPNSNRLTTLSPEPRLTSPSSDPEGQFNQNTVRMTAPPAETYSTSLAKPETEARRRPISNRLTTPSPERQSTSRSLDLERQYGQSTDRTTTAAAELSSADAPSADIEKQQTQHVDRFRTVKVGVFLAICCGTYTSTGFVQMTRWLGKFMRVLLSPLSFVSWLILCFGMLAWRYKAAFALGLVQIGFYLFDRSILAPICQQTQDRMLDICLPMCTVAAYLQYPMVACISERSRQTTNARSPVLSSKQLRFSSLATKDIATQFQRLEIKFDDSTYEALQHRAETYDDLGSDVEQLSRAARRFFDIFTTSEVQMNETLIEDTAFNAHVNILLPPLKDVLAIASRTERRFINVQAQEVKDANQLQNAQETTKVLYSQAYRDRSFPKYLRGIQTSRINSTQTTVRSIHKLAIGHTKATDASGSSARSFKNSHAKFKNLFSAVNQHETWQGSRQKKPRKVFLSLMHSSMQEAKGSLLEWEQEDRRHEEFLFKSPKDRLSQLYRPYGGEQIR